MADKPIRGQSEAYISDLSYTQRMRQTWLDTLSFSDSFQLEGDEGSTPAPNSDLSVAASRQLDSNRIRLILGTLIVCGALGHSDQDIESAIGRKAQQHVGTGLASMRTSNGSGQVTASLSDRTRRAPA